MPFLRPLDSVASSLELRSSKTLIGSGTTTCDVVVPDALELHALLNLGADKSFAKLVPFSTADAGVCYVNDGVVPRGGAVVVHGDRVAFGSPSNAFLFELTTTNPPQLTAASPSKKNSTDHSNVQASNGIVSPGRAFRKALDALRGDRPSTTPGASVIASIQSKLAARNRDSVSSSVSSKPKDQLSRFLLEASTDSLLSDYVERKLQQHRSSSKSRSRPSSIASSNQSEAIRHSRSSRSRRQSTDERNLVEVEKLRLSQRIREVNDVLNGDMDFQASYLSPTSKSMKPTKQPSNKSSLDRRVSIFQSLKSKNNTIEGSEDDEEGAEEEYDDELPTMMEKPISTPSVHKLTSIAVSIQTEHSEQENHSDLPQGKDDESEGQSTPLEHSLDSVPVSEVYESFRKLGGKKPTLSPIGVRGSLSRVLTNEDSNQSRLLSTQPERQGAARTDLHEKLISQMIRRKQHDITSQAFVRWKRGLRIQTQNRKHKAWQLQTLSTRLGKMRRNHIFTRWREFAGIRSQVVVCRLEAFQTRYTSRLVRKCWSSLSFHHGLAAQRRKVLRGLLIRKRSMTRQAAFRRWTRSTQTQSTREELGKLQSSERHKLNIHFNRMADQHYRQASLQPLLSRVMRGWKHLAHQNHIRKLVLRKLLVHGVSKLVQYAWRTWIESTLYLRLHARMKEENDRHIQQTTESLVNQHDQAQSSLREKHAHQLQKFMAVVEEKDQELNELKEQQRTDTVKKAAAKVQWEQDIHGFFEKAIVKCDKQIAQANNQLEILLHTAEDNILSARFGAAQYLVDVMLQQKTHNANELIRLQEAHLAMLSGGKTPGSLSSDEAPVQDNYTAELSSNGRFLHDMTQQRLTRLQQLHLSLAKLAAVSDSDHSLDADRLHHGNFLADVVFQRQQRHISVMTALSRQLHR